MRISELSRRANVPVATIKYYLREGLLPPGEATGATQARYDEGHAERLQLIRALADVGGLSLATIQRILDVLDSEDADVHRLLGTAQYALSPDVSDEADGDPAWDSARSEVDALLTELGWNVTPEAPARDQLTQALLALRQLGLPSSASDLRVYADAAHSVAARELERIRVAATRAEAVETAVVATVLYEPILLALRRLAQEHESARRFRRGDECEIQ